MIVNCAAFRRVGIFVVILNLLLCLNLSLSFLCLPFFDISCSSICLHNLDLNQHWDQGIHKLNNSYPIQLHYYYNKPHHPNCNQRYYFHHHINRHRPNLEIHIQLVVQLLDLVVQVDPKLQCCY